MWGGLIDSNENLLPPDCRFGYEEDDDDEKPDYDDEEEC